MSDPMEKRQPPPFFLTSGCLSREGLEAWASGSLDAAGRERLCAHLLQCELCRDAMEGRSLAENSVDFNYWVEDINRAVTGKVGYINDNQPVFINVSRGTPWRWIAAAAAVALLVTTVLWTTLFRGPELPLIAGSMQTVPTDAAEIRTLPSPGTGPELWTEMEPSDAALLSDDHTFSPQGKALEEPSGDEPREPLPLAIARELSEGIPLASDQAGNDLPEVDTLQSAMGKEMAGRITLPQEEAGAKAAPASTSVKYQATQAVPSYYYASPSQGTSVFNTESIRLPSAVSRNIYSVADQMPVYPGGRDAVQAYFSQALSLPQEAITWNRDTLVLVELLIDDRGHVRRPKMIQGVNEAVDNVVLKTARRMPAWKPGSHQGEVVMVKTIITVRLSGRPTQ